MSKIQCSYYAPAEPTTGLPNLEPEDQKEPASIAAYIFRMTPAQFAHVLVNDSLDASSVIATRAA